MEEARATGIQAERARDIQTALIRENTSPVSHRRVGRPQPGRHGQVPDRQRMAIQGHPDSRALIKLV